MCRWADTSSLPKRHVDTHPLCPPEGSIRKGKPQPKASPHPAWIRGLGKPSGEGVGLRGLKDGHVGGKSSILRESLSSLLTGLHPLSAASPTALLCLQAQPPRKPKPLAGCLYFWQGRGEAGGGCTSLFWLFSEGRGSEDGGTDTWEHRPHQAGGHMGCGTALGLTKPLVLVPSQLHTPGTPGPFSCSGKEVA